MKRVLVTGASGFLGSALLARLPKDLRVTGVARAAGTADIEWLNVDLLDRAATRRALTPWRWDAVIHLAGPVPAGAQDWARDVETVTSHTRAAVNIVNPVPADWDGRFIHASSAVVYGLPTVDAVTETHPRRPLHAYGLAKLMAEEIVLGSNLRDRWVVRMGGLFSANRRTGGLFHFVQAARAGRAIQARSSDPPVPWEILDVEDAATFLRDALAASARDPGAINIGYGETNELVTIAKRIAGRATPSVDVELVGPRPPLFRLDVTKAQSLVSWPPASLDQRLDRLWEAFA